MVWQHCCTLKTAETHHLLHHSTNGLQGFQYWSSPARSGSTEEEDPVHHVSNIDADPAQEIDRGLQDRQELRIYARNHRLCCSKRHQGPAEALSRADEGLRHCADDPYEDDPNLGESLARDLWNSIHSCRAVDRSDAHRRWVL